MRAALLRPAQVPGMYTASASQVLVSALVRRYGSARLRIVLDQPSPAARPGTRYAWQLWRTPATATRFAFT